MQRAAIVEAQAVPETSMRSSIPSLLPHGCRAETARIGRYARIDVNSSDTADNSLDVRLRDHLAPELYTRLTTEGALPAAVVKAECLRLRGDLAAIATYLPSTVVRE